jgi:putative phosphoesterase
MKIAALGDIHGNYQALITVLDHVDDWKPDLILVLGDIVNRGPRSKECLDLIQDRSVNPTWHVIKGNHEGYVLNYEDPDYCRQGVEFDLKQVIHWTYESLTRNDLDVLKHLPTEIKIDLSDLGLVHAYHASTIGDRIGIYPNTPDSKLAGLISEEARLFLVGHTHQPLMRFYDTTLVINTGAVGLPFDGDRRAAYAQIEYQKETWQGKVIRIPYDLKAAEDDFYRSGFIPKGGPIADLILKELQLGWPQLGKWYGKYETAVRDGRISIDDAVYEFLKNPNIEFRNPNSHDKIFPQVDL